MLLIVVAVIGIVTIAAVLTRRGSDGSSTPVTPLPTLDAGQPAPLLAMEACAEMDAVQRDVGENVAAQRVFDELTLAQQEATAAAVSDPLYVALKSGIDAVERSLRLNDPAAARVGIDVVRYQCGLVAGGPPATP